MSKPNKQIKSISPGRKRLFRFGSILVGILILFCVEVSLRLAGVGQHVSRADPLVGFSEVRPLFEKNDSGERYEIPKSRQAFFQPDSFAVEKGTNEFRIFCLGGSTVQGRPYSIETSFTQWLEMTLKAADASRRWEVVNCGGVSYASYRLVPIMLETLQYQPDLFVVYTGHNEFLEARSYSNLKRQPRWLRRALSYVAQLRLFGLICKLKPIETPTKKINLKSEVDALLDYQGGMTQYRRDDDWQNGVIYEYTQNVKRLIEIARENEVPIVFINPVENLRDCPPFKVELPVSFTPEERSEFNQKWIQAKEQSWEDLNEKFAAVQQVLEMDDRHAEAHFLLAKIQEALHDHKSAKESYLRAKDEDICPLRMIEPLHDSLKSIVHQTGTEMIDIRGQFEAEAEFGIPGDQQLIDHVHPRIEGHQKIADSIFQWMVAMGLVQVETGWRNRREKLYANNYATLPDNYFPESVERLRGLKRWATGRAQRLRLESEEASD